MKTIGQKARKPLPYYVRWYESAGVYTVLRNKSFADPAARDKFARKLPRKENFAGYAR